jgi:leader peptidase (prepilin peptidase)/N-methyltransferase
MDVYAYLLTIVSGLIIGSFLNSVIYRLDDLKTIIHERSHCPKCNKKLGLFDLIPLFSFIILHGQCRYCKEKISWQYPLVELFTALIFTLLFFTYGNVIYTYLLVVLSCFLIIIFVYDGINQLIPDEGFWPALILAIVSIFFANSTNYTNNVYGALIGIGIILLIYFITKGRGIGLGDVKLVAIFGLVLGWSLTILNIFLAFVLGAIYGLFLLYNKKKGWKDAVAFGPFLIIGFYISLFWGEIILRWYLGM